MALLKRRKIGYMVQVTDYAGQKEQTASEVVASIIGAARLVTKNLNAGTRGIVVFPTNKKVTAKSVEMAQAAIECKLMGFPEPK